MTIYIVTGSKTAQRPHLNFNSPMQTSFHHLANGNVLHTQTVNSAATNETTAQTGKTSQLQSSSYAQSESTLKQAQSLSNQQSAYPVTSPASSPQHQTYLQTVTPSRHEQEISSVPQLSNPDKSTKELKTTTQINKAQHTGNLQVGRTENSDVKDEDDALEETVIHDSPEYHHENAPEQYYVTTVENEAAARAYQNVPLIHFPKTTQITYTNLPKARLMQSNDRENQERLNTFEEDASKTPDKKGKKESPRKLQNSCMLSICNSHFHMTVKDNKNKRQKWVWCYY